MENRSPTLKGSVNLGLGPTLFKFMRIHSNKVAQYLADTNEIDTYGEVLLRSIRTALKLREKGVTNDDIISSCTHNHKNTIVPFLATLFLNAKSANFDPNLSHLDTIHLLKLVKPKIMFVALESLPFMEKCLNESQVVTDLVVFGDNEKYSNFSEYLVPNNGEEEFEPVAVDDIKATALIMFSSGTTGLPKGICLNHYGLLGRVPDSESVQDGGSGTVLLYTTLYWISFILTLLRAILEGHSRLVCAKFDAANTWKLIEKYKISVIFLAPYHAIEFIAALPEDCDSSSLKLFLTGTTPVNERLMTDLKKILPAAIVSQFYAQTESCGSIVMFNVFDPKEVELQNRKPLSCGKIVPGLKWKIVDPATEETLGPNERGEFRYKLDRQMNGYYKIDSSSAYDSEGYLKSGDIVYYDEDDCFYVVDRAKEMFKYRGWHILPAILEGVLKSHPAVKEAVVIGIPHELDGDHPMGLVVLNKGYEDVTPEDIDRYMNEKVPESQRLRAGVKIVKSRSIIRTTTGKIKRSDIKKMVLNGYI